MRELSLLTVVFWALLSQADSLCDLTQNDDGDKTFPDLLGQAEIGYQLSAQLSLKQDQETVFVNEYYNKDEKSGKVEVYRNGDFKQFVYMGETNEAFTVSGFTCESSPLDETAPPFLEDEARRWLEYEDDITILGPSATLRKGFLAWKKKEVEYLGECKEDRSLMVDVWQQSLEKGPKLRYYFSKPTWSNAYNVRMQIPVRFEYESDSQVQTLDFFNYQYYLSKDDATFNVPEGVGCNRTAKTYEDVPVLLARNHLLRGEMVYHSVSMEAKSVSSFISNFEIAYHYASDMLAYSYTPWKKGSRDKDGNVQTNPFTRIVWDNRNSILYSMNYRERECSLLRNTDYYPSFELPGEDEGNIDLLDPSILVSNDGFVYLGERKERGIPVKVFEKEVRPMFLGYTEAPVGIITRLYSSNEAVINTGNQEKDSPVRITIRWFEDEEKAKISGVMVMNIYSYSNDVPLIQDYFNIGMCFRDYDASTWIKLTFPNMGVTRDTLQARTDEIEEEFLGVLLTHTETTPARVQQILIDVGEDEFSVEAMILERPPYGMEFDRRDKLEIANWNASFGILSEDDCLKKCADYGKDSGVDCKVVSYCGVSCYVSTDKKALTDENKECMLYDRPKAFVSLPSMDELTRSIRQLVVDDQFSLYFEINVGDQVKPVRFKASSFGDSVGDTRERLVSRLLRDENFKITFPGMKMMKGDKDRSKPSARFSLPSCLQACLNDPYCETLSYCRGTECVLSESYIVDVDLDKIVKNNKCIVLARNYIQAYNKLSGITLTKSAKSVSNAKTEDGCAHHCTKETKFECRSFDFCKDKEECLLHTTHYLQLKGEGEGVKITENCTHYSKKYVYDFKKIPRKRTVGDAQLSVGQNSVEECAKECVENGGFTCTAFDFCEGIEVIDNKCFLIQTSTGDTKTVDRTDCSHYVNQNIRGAAPTLEKRYSNSLAGGLGFLFFLIGSAIGVGATYFIAFKYANRQ